MTTLVRPRVGALGIAAVLALVLVVLAPGTGHAQGAEQSRTPSALAGISPEAADRVIEIMTEYTMAVAGGFAGGSMLMSLFSGQAPMVIVGGLVGAVVGNLSYASYLRELYNRPIGQN